MTAGLILLGLLALGFALALKFVVRRSEQALNDLFNQELFDFGISSKRNDGRSFVVGARQAS